MSLTPSTMLPLGSVAPDFCLPDTSGNKVLLSDLSQTRGLLVVFLCNHCPYVKHVRDVFASLAADYQNRGISVVGINSNDVVNYPQDHPDRMIEEKRSAGYTFPYLFDETQEVAKSYRAACTPDFYLFDQKQRLVYRGQMDASRPGNSIPVSGIDLTNAMDALLDGREISQEQKPSMGCNIKWKAGNSPEYF